jgi:hypothetical protein
MSFAGIGALPFVSAWIKSGPFPQQEILEHDFPLARRQWRTAGAAHLAVDRLRPGFDPDDVIESVTMRAIEMNTLRHEQSPSPEQSRSYPGE